jgi:hypothetical protein
MDQGSFKVSLQSQPNMGLGYLQGFAVQLQPLNQTGSWTVSRHPNGISSDDSYLLDYVPHPQSVARFGQPTIIFSQYYPDDIENRITFDSLGSGYWAINNHDKTLVFTFYNAYPENPQSLVTPMEWIANGFGRGIDQRWLFTPAT